MLIRNLDKMILATWVDNIIDLSTLILRVLEHAYLYLFEVINY